VRCRSWSRTSGPPSPPPSPTAGRAPDGRPLRSVLLPLTAILINLLSVAATQGVLVLVFQHGIGTDLLGFQRTG
jgi:hypothetical protein